MSKRAHTSHAPSASGSVPGLDLEDERKESKEKRSNVNLGWYWPLALIKASLENVKAHKDFLEKNPDALKLLELEASNISDEPDIEGELKELTEKRMQETRVDIGHYQPLIRAIIKSNVEDQRNFLDKYPLTLNAEIDEFGNTIFHLIVQKSVNKATIMLLKELVSKCSLETLQIKNVKGLTALEVAASAGNTDAVKMFVKKSKLLLVGKENRELMELLPVHYAAQWARKETVRYLLSQTHSWTDDMALDFGALLLRILIDSNLNGIALGLLKRYPKLARWEENEFWKEIIDALSKNYLAYESGIKLGLLESLIYHYIPVKYNQDHVDWPHKRDSTDLENQHGSTDLENQQNHESSTNCSQEIADTFDGLNRKLYTIMWNPLIYLIPSIKDIHDQKLMHTQTLEVVRLMLISKVDWTYKEAIERLKEPVLTAASLGIHEFVNEVLEAYPNSALFYDKDGCNIFHLAVLHRKEKVFNLIHDQVASIRDYNNYVTEKKEHRNILHLAGELVPSTHVPGAALQMQRELQWFKGIREFFQPFLQQQRNKYQQTPAEVFKEKHKELMENGEKWMRDTATSCSVVAALIITIVFAAAFTVPGGIDSNGIPNYLKQTSYKIFAISVAVALFSSTTSVQIFLGMLTSRYAAEDFMEALPRKLTIGLMTLFFSSSSMMVAFGAAFCIAISYPWKWIIILICLLGCLPVSFFAWLQFPLLLDILKSTYGPNIIIKLKKSTY